MRLILCVCLYLFVYNAIEAQKAFKSKIIDSLYAEESKACMVLFDDSSYVIAYNVLQKSEVFNNSAELKRKIDIKIVKYANNSTIEWERTLDTKFVDHVVDLVIFDKNKILVLSESWDDSYKNERKIILTRIEELGNVIYQKELLPGTPSAILMLNPKDIFIAYSSKSKNPPSYELSEELFISKIDLGGQIQWTKSVGYCHLQASALNGTKSFYLKKKSNNEFYSLIKDGDGSGSGYIILKSDKKGKLTRNYIELRGYVDDYYLDRNNNFYTVEQGWRTLSNNKRVRTLKYNHYKKGEKISSITLEDSLSYASTAVLKLTRNKKLFCCYAADKKLIFKLIDSVKNVRTLDFSDKIYSNCSVFIFNKKIIILSVAADNYREMGHGHELIMSSFIE
jgi:hypothetical protein